MISDDSRQLLRQEVERLMDSNSLAEILQVIQGLVVLYDVKSKRADELFTELSFQNAEKAKRADELTVANKELAFQNEEKAKRADELLIANEELVSQNHEKARRASELVIANIELAFQIEEKAKRANELAVANNELAFQNAEKAKRADELTIANKELADVSVLSQATETLKQSEYKFRTIADFAYDWEYLTDATGQLIYISPSCERISGYKQEEFIYDNSLLEKIIHPDDAKLFEDHSERMLSLEHRHEIDEYDFRILKKNGSIAHIGHLSGPVSDDSGKYNGRRASNRDITASMATKENLQRISARLALATRAGGIGIWDYDIGGNILMWDSQMFSLYGISMNDYNGADEVRLNAIHPDDREHANREFQMAIRGEIEYDTEYRIVLTDGDIRYIRSLAIVQRDNVSGKPVQMVGTDWDITTLRRAEIEKLDESNKRYRSIFQGSPDGIIIIDADTQNIISANPKQCEMLGYTEDELMSMNISGIHPKNSFQETLFRLKRAIHRKNSFSGTVQCLTKNGDIIYSDIVSNLIMVNGQKCVVGFFRDITNRLKAAEALRESNAYQEILINYANVPIIVWDPRFSITRFNRAFEKITGRNEAAVIGQAIDILFPPEQVSHSLALIRTTLSGERWVSIEIDIQHIDGSVRAILWNSATLFAADGSTPVATIAQGHDITDRKKAEFSLQEALARAEAGNRLKADFIRTISHEIRTPLNGIIGFGSLLREPDITPEERQEYGLFMEASGSRLINTISDYLVVSEISSGTTEIFHTRVSARSILEE
ncbi:MAG: PAS domain S-box protein, partial [Spirochaetota bacterium]